MTDISGFETIEFDVSGHVATLTLNRPEKLNSFNERMADEVAAAWRRVREDEDIRVAIIQANGERAFCTGIDVEKGQWWYHEPIFNQEDPGVLLGPKAHLVWKPVSRRYMAWWPVAQCISLTRPILRFARNQRCSSTRTPTLASCPRSSRWACWREGCLTAT